MPALSSPEFLVVGAGLAGLTAAKVLSQSGREVLLLEKSDGVGGRVRTDQYKDFLLDRGFQVLLTAYPELPKHLNLSLLRLHSFESGATIFSDGHFSKVGDPFRNVSSIMSTAFTKTIGMQDKIKLLKLRNSLIGRKKIYFQQKDDKRILETFEELGFTSKAINSFFKPLVGGIQLDPSLSGSTRLCFLVLKMLFIGDAAVPSRGMGAISEQLSKQINESSIRLTSTVDKVEGKKVILESGESFLPSNLIIATEGPATAKLLGQESPLSRSVSCIYFSASQAPSSSKAILLNGEKNGPALNVAIMSNISPSYSKNGKALIAVAIPDTIKTDSMENILIQMRKWFGDSVDSWEHIKTYSIEHGQPDLRPGDPFRKSIKNSEGVYICGDHRDTPSIQGALVSGRRTAEICLKN
ncbi:MAG: Putative thiazole biosynthetic enzyme [Acidimicrobiaceae bacterium]|nr:MAG: Putative thiazole biosynthetic enzyme [Acidimicrobiaceae bacterium]